MEWYRISKLQREIVDAWPTTPEQIAGSTRVTVAKARDSIAQLLELGMVASPVPVTVCDRQASEAAIDSDAQPVEVASEPALELQPELPAEIDTHPIVRRRRKRR